MSRSITSKLLLVLALLCPLTGWAAEFAVVQQAARTSTGTQDFTSTGFGTPVAAICSATTGTANGTKVDHAIIGFGATDGTRQWSVSGRSQDNVATDATAHKANTADLLHMVDTGGTTFIRFQFSSWITDGLRINYSVAPAAAVLVNCTLIGGPGVSNAYASTVTTPSTINTGTVVTAPNFQPDVLIGAVSGSSTFNDSSAAGNVISIGFATRAGSNPHPQNTLAFNDVNGGSTSDPRLRLENGYVGRDHNGTVGIEMQDVTSQGFTAVTRDTGSARTMGYLVLKFNGLSFKSLTMDSPTATGSKAYTGIGFTPQFGIMALGSNSASNSSATDATAEVWGFSMFTPVAQASTAIWSDDGQSTSNTESVTHNQPVFLRKDAATFFDGTFTSFTYDTVTFSFATVDSTTRKWFGLFISGSSTSSSGMLLGVGQ